MSLFQKYKYQDLLKALEEAGEYGAVDVHLFAPIEKRGRYLYITGLTTGGKLPVPICVYRVERPHNRTFAWLIPADDKVRDDTQQIAAVAMSDGELTLKHSRGMRQKGIEHVRNACGDDFSASRAQISRS